MKKKNLLVTVLIIAMVTMFAMPMSVFAGISPAFHHVNAESYTFTPNDPTENGGLTDAVVWHFILNGLDEGTSPSTITVNFQNAGLITAVAVEKPNDKTQHFYIGTPTHDKIISATAVTDSTDYNKFNLSHVAWTNAPPMPAPMGTLIVNKNVENKDYATPQSYEFKVTSGEAILYTFFLADDGTQTYSLTPGAYSVEEVTTGTAFSTTVQGDPGNVFDFNVTNKGTTKVDFVNTWEITNEPPTPVALITVNKEVENPENVTTLQDYNFTITNTSGEAISFSLADNGTTTAAVAPGTYIVEEVTTGAGFTTTVDGNVDNSKTITLSNLGSANISFVNTWKGNNVTPPPTPTLGSITVKKNVIGVNGITDILDDTTFEFSYTSGGALYGSLPVSENSSNILTNLPFGTYTFTEAVSANYIDITVGTLGTSVAVTIDKDHPNGKVDFVNKLKDNGNNEETGGNGGNGGNGGDDPEIIADIEDKETPKTDTPITPNKPVTPNKPIKVIPEDEIPLVNLPETGGVAALGVMGLGGLIASIGAYLRRKEEK